MGVGHSIYIVELGIAFPDGIQTNTIPISNTVIEYRNSAGVKRTRGMDQEKFESSNLETYVSIGIPEPVYEDILQSVKAQTRLPVGDKSTARSNGYAWVTCKIALDPTKVQIASVLIYDEDKGLNADCGKLFEFCTSVMKNLLGVSIFGARLTKSIRPGSDPNMPYNLSLTLSNFHLQDFTTISSPPLSGSIPVSSLQITPSNDVAEMLRSMTITAKES